MALFIVCLLIAAHFIGFALALRQAKAKVNKIIARCDGEEAQKTLAVLLAGVEKAKAQGQCQRHRF